LLLNEEFFSISKFPTNHDIVSKTDFLDTKKA